jgi:type II secretory pathway component PulF
MELSTTTSGTNSNASADLLWGFRDARPAVVAAAAPTDVSVSAGQQGSGLFARRKIGKNEVLMFTSELAIMCQSGVELAEALRDAATDCPHPQMRSVLQQVYASVANGASFSAALQPFQEIFGGAYVGSIAAAESAGTVPQILSRLANLLRGQIRIRNTLTATLSYPVILMAIASLVIAAVIFFVLPQFGKVFAKMQKTPPPMTQVLLSTSAFAREHALVLLAAAAGAGIGLYLFSRTDRAARWRDRVVLNAVMLGKASRALYAGTSFRLMGNMLESGVPLLDCVRLCQSTVKNRYFRELFATMEEQVLQGAGIGPTVAGCQFLPRGIAQMVASAERSGRLGNVLEMIGEHFEEDGEARLRHVVKLLEPLIIVVMGLVVAVVVTSVMLPLLNVSTMSR